MKNRKFYSFERNHYFYGKLLTSRDFQSEQEYLNNKRRFLNRTLHGTGIACGMTVLKADDMSVVIQSGFALDGGGREIVVPDTQVVKLSTIDGFQELSTSCACLGIAYQETFTDPVYSVMGTDGEEEKSRRFNSLKEGYRFYLLDEEQSVPAEKEEDEFIKKEVIYQDGDMIVTQLTPAYAVKGKHVRVRVVIEKRKHTPFVFSMKYRLLAECFVNRQIEIRADNLSQEYGEKTVLEYELIPEEFIFGGNEVTLTIKDIEISKADRTEKLGKECRVFLKPVLENALECILDHSYKAIMDSELEQNYDELLLIARINLFKSDSTVLIDSVEPSPYAQHVYNVRQLMIFNKLNEFLPEPFRGYTHAAGESAKPVHDDTREGGVLRVHSSGVFEMSLGNGGEAGRAYFSDEIMHGLGSGAVFVDVGVEYLNKDSAAGQEWEEVILGDSSIFASGESRTEDAVYQIDSAVKLLPDRGTFVVGVRPKVKTGKISLRVRWFAFKPEDLQQRVAKKEQNGCIMIRPDTIVIQPKGTAHINPVFINMPEEALSYSLLDSEGGKIENNGIYTAPAQEGVYEIKVSCISDPDIFAQAFVIVSQKKQEEE